MSRIKAMSKEPTLLSTAPYVDALLTVQYEDNQPSSSTSGSPRKPLVSLFKVHRIVLSRLSRYFMNAFKKLEEQNPPTSEETDLERQLWDLKVTFQGKKEKSCYHLFSGLLDFLYGKPLAANESSQLFEYLELATIFEIPTLTTVVSETLLSGITKDSSFSLLQQSVKYDAPAIRSRCLELVARNFQTLFPTIKSQLNELPLQVFSALLNHPSLSVTSEYRVYKIVRSFYGYHVDENGETQLEKADRKALFSAVRIAHLKYNELEKVIRDDIVPKSLLMEALTHRLTVFEKPANLPADENLPLRLRKRTVGRLFEPPSAHEAHEANSSQLEVPKGVIYFLATGGGRSEWKNPSLTGSIKVSCSSIEKGKPHNFVDLEPQDCWSMDIPASWVAIDLRQGRLIPSHFTLRHGGNSKMDTLRNWLIQACDNDGDKWVEISRHSNDASLQGAYGMHTWKITTNLQRPFRQFRILQTGHNSGSSNFLALSYIELYGHFFPKTPADTPTKA
jgi:hypothetical protein